MKRAGRIILFVLFIVILKSGKNDLNIYFSFLVYNMLLFASIVIAIHERALDYNNNGFEEYSIRAVIDAADFDVSQIPYLSLFVPVCAREISIVIMLVCYDTELILIKRNFLHAFITYRDWETDRKSVV